ncbi:MKI67 FHA domain-interacting nucleolar phosphoprotein-like [Diabrotica virgifera virgifera]|uniref:MKI67 FHA domain-interacting nucleolar phosphoprotein-like n=1 Tax=Diabrotica virgifera virgifera TaxID=50390 RepID=A0A6P7GVS6_DIAVI|nr:MKI67 FHA domain-interacting nucleolar phosphoprotein-like [Diabrotica virgifera virgifera]
MTKTRAAEVLSLEKSKQKEVVKETKQLKKKIKDGTVTVKGTKKALIAAQEQKRGLIFISHLPHGFYEDELKKYFTQFGKVTNVIVCRSGKTGNSKGYGYVEFVNPEVAKIAAETMNNYLMFKKRITANFVAPEKRPKGLFMGKPNTITRYSSKVRRQKQYLVNIKLDPKTQAKRTANRLTKINKKLEWLKNAGVETSFTPSNLEVKQKKSVPRVSNTHKELDFDSDIELKIPVKKAKSAVTSSKNSPKVLSTKASKSNKKLNKSVSSESEKTPSIKKKLNKASKTNIVEDTSPSDKKSLKKKNKSSKGITKKSKKPEPINTQTVKRIARELIKKRGSSLLGVPVEVSNGKTIKKKLSKK